MSSNKYVEDLEKLLLKMQNMLSRHHEAVTSHEIILKIITDILEESQILTKKEVESKFAIEAKLAVDKMVKELEEQRKQEKEFNDELVNTLANMRPEGNA